VHLRADLQHDFVAEDGTPDEATDRTPPDQKFASNRGHGTGTLSLLAGARLAGTSPDWPGFMDYVGGAPLAQIIPVRIADWVVRFSTSTMVQGFDWARLKGAHVLSMSMGGITSQALTDAVNLAYEAGLVMVTAAGNNYAGLPTPKSIVFPARFRRVLAACGVMADGRAYADLQFGTMQGNYGPESKMDTAIGAYTPNVPWAQIDCGNVVDMNGAGTSAATPQVAAAAALWLAANWNKVSKYSEPWMRIEAVRHALFAKASKSTPAMDEKETHSKIGQGVLRADAALAIAPPKESELQKLPPAQASWTWAAEVLFGGGVSLAAQTSPRNVMLALELTQMAQHERAVDEAIEDPDRPADQIPKAARRRYLEAVLDYGQPSAVLRRHLEQLLDRPASVAAAAPEHPIPWEVSHVPWEVSHEVRKTRIKVRQLRVFALDPSVGKTLATTAVNETTLSVPWEKELNPGPVGDYLEVVDVDPASGKVYDPVDLNHQDILAQDGLTPSEGNPKFHQQMVYAVGMNVITHFEQALGRVALWAPHWEKHADHNGGEYREVPRLRIYPHALRTQNAYYSPEKKALLFGYFPASSRQSDSTAPGSMVFSCLSSDVVAHEMTHALLDGLHRRFEEPSNPDVPAFHEAFADIVALFQHFTVTELVRFEIGRARGELSEATLLSGLAKQFGEGISRGAPLRNYTDPHMQKLRYDETQEPHELGSLLVFAVYEAFRNIVARRTADLIRLATGGTGVLAPGALHPDLVERLTVETCKAAKHVLHMCIRALDYMPPVDITFGDYLRALITADLDFVADDRYGYRIAFMEAFRKRGILPIDVRTISEQSLAWNTLRERKPGWLKDFIKAIDLRWNRDLSRSRIFELNEKNRLAVWRVLDKVFREDPGAYAHFGLLPNVPRWDEEGNVIRQPPPGATTFEVHSVRPARRLGRDGSFLTDIVAIITQRQRKPIKPDDPAGWFWFRGGVTLIIDSREEKEKIRYAVVKHSDSETRLVRQRQTEFGAMMPALRTLYFGKSGSEPFAVMHARE
jgi:subtilase family protein